MSALGRWIHEPLDSWNRYVICPWCESDIPREQDCLYHTGCHDYFCDFTCARKSMEARLHGPVDCLEYVRTESEYRDSRTYRWTFAGWVSASQIWDWFRQTPDDAVIPYEFHHGPGHWFGDMPWIDRSGELTILRWSTALDI